MAQLKDLLVTGASRFIGSIYSDQIAFRTLWTRQGKTGTEVSTGQANQILMSDGSTTYWSDFPTTQVSDAVNASDIALGILKVQYGGTGRDTLTKDHVLVGDGTNQVALRGILNNTGSAQHLGWNSAGAAHADNLRLVDVNTIAYWNGSYNGTNSNLTKLGTVSSGTWQATTIGTAYGGTGNTSYDSNRLIYSQTNSKLAAADSIYATSDSISVGDTTITSGYTFQVKGKTLLTGNASTTANKSSQLQIYNTGNGNVALELWRETAASWQISNESGTLHFRNNYTSAKQTTYSVDSLTIDYNTGIVNIKGTDDSTTTATGVLRVAGGAGIAKQLTAGRVVASTNQMVVSAGKVYSNISGSNVIQPAKTASLYADGLAITNPATSNDVAFLRVTGTGESDTLLEIATGDDIGAGEEIAVRQYSTSNTSRGIKLLDKNGNMIPEADYARDLGDSSHYWKKISARIINQAWTDGTHTAQQDKGASTSPRYFPVLWKFNHSLEPSNGDIITIKTPGAGHDYGVFLSTDNGAHYYPIVLIDTGRMTTQYPAGSYLTLIFDNAKTAASVFAPNGSDGRVTSDPGVWRVVNFYDSNTTRIWELYKAYGHYVANNAIKRYQILFQALAPNEKKLIALYETDNNLGTGKTLLTTEFDPLGEIFYYNSTGTYAAAATIDAQRLNYTALADMRYTFNITSDSSVAATTAFRGVAPNPVYLRVVINSLTGGAKVDGNQPLTSTLPTTSDGKYYIYLGNVYEWYRIYLNREHPVYYHDGTKIVRYYGNTVGSTNINLRGSTNATMTAASTNPKITFSEGNGSQPVHLIYSDYDTYRSPAGLKVIGGTSATPAWFEVEGNVYAAAFKGNADSATLASKATAADITTNTNAVTIYTNTTGTFGQVRSGNGAFYSTGQDVAPTFGTLPAAQGGTGQTTLKNAANALINALDTGSSVLTAQDYIITQYVGGGTTTTTYHRRPASAVRVGGLLVGRKLKVKLDSTTDVTFDGTADVTTIPVSGSLPIANGGTAATTAADARTNLGLGTIATYDAATAGTKDTWGKVPVIGGSDGVLEVGKYIDFHTTDGNDSDYNVRIKAENTGLTITGTTTGTFSGDLTGNASTAATLQTGRKINGTTFNGSADITTANWGTARNISISDSGGTYTGTATSVNGSAAVTLKLPATITATLKGNADTATKATQDGSGNVITSTYVKKAGDTMTGTLTVKGLKGTTDVDYGEVLPASGAEGQLFFQISNEQYELPVGGTTGQALVKISDTDRQVQWADVNAKLIPNNNVKFYVSGSTSNVQNTLDSVFNTNVYVENNVLQGAAWNDYAEYRVTKEIIEPGRVVIENGDDTLSLSTERMQAGAEIVSDTFGMAIGFTEKAQTPIAATGRVLAYTDKDRETFKIGQPVCSGSNGTVSLMTDEEARNYPWLIIGTVSAIPQYETWGQNNIQVNNRIWIRVR